MKPLAVASCWQVPNYGSVLQAYAAQAALDSLGVPNETLWYEPERSLPERLRRLRLDPARVGRRLARAADSAREARLGPGAAAGRAARAEALGKFAREYLRLSPRLCGRAALEGAVPGYGAFLSGSDQLWHPANYPDGFYTLDFVPEEVPKLAWAASFGVGGQPPGSSAGSTGFPRGRSRAAR